MSDKKHNEMAPVRTPASLKPHRPGAIKPRALQIGETSAVNADGVTVIRKADANGNTVENAVFPGDYK